MFASKAMSKITTPNLFPPEGQFDEFKAPDIALWKLFRAELEHENNLVNQRLTWLLSSQTFMFAAFALVLSEWLKTEIKQEYHLVPLFLGLLCCYGIYMCFVVMVAVGRAHRQLARLQKLYSERIAACGFKKRVPPLQMWMTRFPWGIGEVESIPAATAIIWIVLLLTTSFRVLSFPFVQPFLNSDGPAICGIGIAVSAVAFICLRIGFAYGRRKSQTTEDTEENDNDEPPNPGEQGAAGQPQIASPSIVPPVTHLQPPVSGSPPPPLPPPRR
jgi:hypothetical protein